MILTPLGAKGVAETTLDDTWSLRDKGVDYLKGSLDGPLIGDMWSTPIWAHTFGSAIIPRLYLGILINSKIGYHLPFSSFTNLRDRNLLEREALVSSRVHLNSLPLSSMQLSSL